MPKDGKINDFEIEAEALKLVESTKKHYEDNRREWVEMWRECDEAWRSRNKEKTYEGFGNISAPELMNAVETLVGKEMEILTAPKYPFELDPSAVLDRDIYEETTRFNEELMRRIYDLNKSESRLEDVIRNKKIYGSQPVKSFYEKEIKNIKQRQLIQGKPTVRETPIVTKDFPTFELVDLVDFYCDLRDPGLKKATVEIWTTNLTYIRSIEKQSQLQHIDEIDQNMISEPSEQDKKDKEELAGKLDHRFLPQEQAVEVKEYWGPIPKSFVTRNEKDKDTMIEGVIFVIGAFVVKIMENPLWTQEKPYFMAREMKRHNETYGIGVCGPNLSSQQALNDAKNMLNDLLRLLVKPAKIVDRLAEIYDEQLQERPNQIIETNDMNGIRYERPPHEAAVAGFNAVNMHRQDIQDYSGANKFLQGRHQGSTIDRTARGVTTLFQSALGRLRLYLKAFDSDFLQPLFTHQYQLAHQYMNNRSVFRVLGNDIRKFKKQPLEMLLGEYRVMFKGLKFIGDNESKADKIALILQNMDDTKATLIGADNIRQMLVDFFRFNGMEETADSMEKDFNENEFTPAQEHQKVLSGLKVRLEVEENHQQHIQEHTQFITQLDQMNLEPRRKEFILRHLQQHIAAHEIMLENTAQAVQFAEGQMR